LRSPCFYDIVIYMRENLVFRGRQFTKEEIELIKNIVKQNWLKGKKSIAKVVCERIGWYSLNGRLKVIPCLEALRRMEQIGLLSLPKSKKPSGYHKIKILTAQQVNFKIPNQITDTIKKTDTLYFQLAKSKKQLLLWRYLIQQYHYLGYTRLVGRHLKYFVYWQEKLVALISFSDGIYHHRLRDNYLGWDENKRKENLHLVINNNRFLILPWVKITNLGSRILSEATKIVPIDWEKRYGYRPKFFETFVEVDRFIGTVYKAANWKLLGRTEGKGRRGMNYFSHGRVKEYYIYNL